MSGTDADITLSTPLSNEDLMGLLPVTDPIEHPKGFLTGRLVGMNSVVYVHDASPPYPWMVRFGVEYNHRVILNRKSGEWNESLDVFNVSLPAVIKASHGAGWATYYDSVILFWHENSVTLNQEYPYASIVLKALRAEELDVTMTVVGYDDGWADDGS